MSNQIIGNTEYKSIKDKAYINGTQENIMRLAAELDKAGINYSGRIGYKSAVTVEAADRAKALELMNGIISAAKGKPSEENHERNIIGNAEYRFISDKRYIKGETEAMLRTADRLTAENISFSGRINGDTVTLTVSGDEMKERVKKYFAEEKNISENIWSAYLLAPSSDAFEDGYYISEVNIQTGAEIAPYRSSMGDIPMFLSVDEAVKSAANEGITLSNSEAQLDNWRSEEAEKEKQSILAKSREMIGKLPKTDGEIDEYFVLREQAVDWIYFNPDGADGEGQFVITSLYEDDIRDAFEARINTENYEKFGQSAFTRAIENGRQVTVNADVPEFERYALSCINSRDKDNVIVCSPVITGSGYNENFESVIERIENHFENVREHKEAAFKQQYVDLTNKIIDKQKDITDFTENGDLVSAAAEIEKLSAIVEKAAFAKTKLLEMDITADDVKALRSIQPARKSVQNMLENEVAQTPKFEKLLGEEMGEKSAYEMRNSGNEWRNDESKTVTVVDIQKRDIPDRVNKMKKAEGIPKGEFINRDTGIGIQFGKRSLREIIAKALPDERRQTPVEARMAALYQMQDLIENSICFDSQISEANSTSKSPHTLFIHRLYGVYRYDNEVYLANIAIEEFYNKGLETEIDWTASRVYSFRDIKITPIEALRLHPDADLQNVDKDTSTDVTKISISQLYDIVKTYDEKFFENPNAVGRLDREAEIEAQNKFKAAMEIIAEKENTIENALNINGNPILFSDVVLDGGNDVIVGGYIDDDSVRYMDEYMEAVSAGNSDTVDVQVNYYVIGGSDNEAIEADEKQAKYIYEHLNEVLDKADLLESNRYSVEITDDEIANSDRNTPEKNLEFTVITFEDGSVYVEGGQIDDSNVKDTAAYAEMFKNNFDVNNIEDLDESIKVEYAVYRTGDGEAVMPTDEELAEIRNDIDDFIDGRDPVSEENSYLHPWQNDDDILYGMTEMWKKRHNDDPQISDKMDSDFDLLPKNLKPTSRSGGVGYYDTLSSVRQVKLSGKEWLDPFAAAVEMNRRGVDYNDIELVNAAVINSIGYYTEKDMTPEQFAVFDMRIENDPSRYDELISSYRKMIAEREKGFAEAQNALENNLPEVVQHTVASDELEEISEKIFTDDTDKKTGIAKQYLGSGAFSFDSIYVKVKKTDDNVLFSLDNGFEITYPWSDVAAAFEQAAISEMEWYYTSGHVLNLYNDYLKKDTAAGGDLGVQLDRATFTDWVTGIITGQNSVKTAYEANDKALFEGTVRREVDSYFYMLCNKDESIDGYDLKDISDFVNEFCESAELRKEIYAAVTGNITVSLDALQKNEVGSEINLNNEAEKLPENVQNKVKPIYRKTKEEAIEARETDLYFADRQETRNCASAIDRSISDNNVGGSFNGGKAISDLLTEYSIDRIAMIVAARVSDAGKWDERFSRKNVEWANDILNSFNSEQVNAVSRLGLKSHSVHLNNVADELRINYEMFRSIQLGKIKEEKPEQISSDVWGSTVNSQEDSFKIYQVKNGEEYHGKRFAGLSELESAPDIADYELVYSGQLSGLDITGESTNAILENIYTRFNIDRPQDFTGRSLSVSDVVVLHNNDSKTAHYVDTAGFTDVPEFLKDRTVPAVTNGTIEKYGLDIDFKSINSIVLRTSAEEYIGGIDSDGHERRDNYTLSETDVEFYYSEHNAAVIRFDNNYPIGDMPVTIEEALEEIQDFLDKALNDRDKNVIMSYKDGRGEYVYPRELLEEKFNNSLDEAKNYISSFCESEYGSTPDLEDLKNVNIAYTTLTDEELPVQVTADLIDFKIIYEFDGEIFKEKQYSSLNEMVENALSALDFDELVSVPEDILEKHSSLETVLNNSHLPENIEGNSEQLSMFESTPKRKSSDEIVSYYSSAKETPQMEESSPADTSANGKLKASELAVGDRFIFQGEEVTVASFKGIYPDDIGVIKIKRSDGTDLEVTSNVNKYDLVNYGKYIGNDEEKNVSGRSEAPADNIPQQEKPERKNDISADMIPCPPGTPKYSYVIADDALYYHKSDDHMERVNAPEKNITRIKAMTELRDSLHHLLDLQLENTDGRYESEITSTQEKLGKQYDEFSEKYGLISSAENKKLYREDNGYHLIKSLERLDKDGNFEGKADIFYKKTVSPRVIADHCNNANDALILSLSEKCSVDLGYMSILTGKTEEELTAELGNKIFQNPQKGMRWESADEYLTGNVRQKLAAAEALGLERNAEALRAVIPEKINAADISARLGSAWIDPDYIRQFIIETIRPNYITSKKIEVKYSEAADKWKVEGWRTAYANTLATETYGTHDMSAYEIIEAALNMKKAEVRERVRDEYGNFVRDRKDRYIYVVNQEKTMVVQAKQDKLKRKFSEWIFADPDRREKLETIYNEKFNSVRLREYDGSHLNFVGMNSAIELKPHQKNAVARDLYSEGNTLLAHEVGSGKTYEMIAIAMEGKRLGLHSKSLIAVPNALTEQWGDSFRTLYPNANVLVATEKDFKKENRRDLFAKIAAGDWDTVIIGHSQHDMIHLSKERELDILYTELDKLQKALEDMTNESGGSFSVKQIEKSIKAYESKVEKLLSKTSGDDMLCFEQLGIDKLFVDESQNYKNLETSTKMQNVSGIGSGGSGKSMQLLMKCKYLDEITGGKGTVFASGTPISNSMSEMYTLMRYLQADKLSEMGIHSFDQWASVFGETTTSMELSPEGNGKYQMKTRFSKFQNLPELMNAFKECADIKTADSLNLDRPDYEMHNVNVPATAIQLEMIKDLGERARDIRAGAVQPTEDNMCKLTVDGRKIGLDQRCIDPSLPDDPNSKVNVCINNVFDIWQRTADKRSTQLIFSDLATPQAALNENTFTVYRNGANIYEGKLFEKDTAEKIADKLDSKPPKDYTFGSVSEGDIIMLHKVDHTSETAHNTAFEMRDGKLSEISPEKWSEIKHSPEEFFQSERKFCVYDDIKKKLIEKGIPESEIAFIHDFDKAEDKQKLFDKMNKGDVRVLIGSTLKCGAGMNAQHRMIALHDLDAPMRPSDMSQRHGRIIRQGNMNPKVDIYRYTTDQTFDAYLYQMLENKQKFISQIMTDKSPVRSCEDVDEVALDYAEVKALCAGSPLIREKIDLETAITKLNVLKSSFLSQKYSVQDKAYKTLPQQKAYTENYIEKLQADIDRVQSVKPLENEDGKKYYPVKVGDKEYHDKEKAGEAIREAIRSNKDIYAGKERYIGSYRGFEMYAFADSLGMYGERVAMKINLKGACDHYGELNMNSDVNAGGNIIRLDNIINGIELEKQKQEERLANLCADIEEAKAAAEAVFPQEQELTEKEKRLAEVNALLSQSDISDGGDEAELNNEEIAYDDLEKNEKNISSYER